LPVSQPDDFLSQPSLITLGEIHKTLSHELEKAGISPASHEARILLCQRCGVGWGGFYDALDVPVTQDILKKILEDVEKRLAGMPMSKIIGVQEFYGREFIVSKDVLDPRPDTEMIIDLALKRFGRHLPLRILDLGTGSGCIVLTLLCEFSNASALAADISGKALDIAYKNAEKLGLSERCTFVESNWFNSIVYEEFDLIVSNPPYIRSDVIPELPREVQNHDPILALDGGQDGLEAYKIIFSVIKNYLKPNGIGLFEIGFDQRESIMRLGRESRFMHCDVHPDLSGQPRVAEICSGDKS
jgi:release factor glutamine methyltransferase